MGPQTRLFYTEKFKSSLETAYYPTQERFLWVMFPVNDHLTYSFGLLSYSW